MSYANIVDVIWATGPLVQVAILLALWHRCALRRHLAFSLYLGWEILQFCVLFPLRTGSYKMYFTAYWVGNAISVLLTMLVLAGVYRETLARVDSVRSAGKNYLKLVVLVALCVALATSVWSLPKEQWRVLTVVLALQQAVRVFELLLLVVLVCGAVVFGMKLKTFAFGIALGFGAYAALQLIALTIRNASSYAAAGRMFTLVNTAAYTLAAAIWLGFAYLEQPEVIEAPVGRMAEDLDNWRKSMQGGRR